MLINEMIGQNIKARVKLHNYRYPRSGVQESGFAIVIFDVVSVLEGQMPEDFIYGNNDGKIEYQLTAVGTMPKIERNQEYVLQGTWDIDKKWGPQCKVDFVRMDYNFNSIDDQCKFFSFFMTDNQIKSLFDIYDDPASLLENQDIESLTKIKGIGPATARRMCVKYEQCKDKGQAYIQLKAFGLTKTAIDRIVAAYGSPDEAAAQVNANPYVLIKHVRGFGWLKADTAARARGFARNCKERVMAYIQYYLDIQAESAGNIWVTIDDLMTNVINECSPLTKDQLSVWIKEVTASQNRFEELYVNYLQDPGTEFPLLMYCQEGRKIGLSYYRLLERKIADELQRLQEGPHNLQYDKHICESMINEVEEEQGYEYTEEQIKAIYDMLNSNVIVLTGSAGTGKTTTLKPVIRILRYYGMFVSQCALAGRASSLLSEVTGLEGKTIHRLLGYIPETEKFAHSATNPLKSDVVILDETSMVGEELFLSLLKAIKTGSKLIMLGDIKQLPPINVGNILNDCIRSGYITADVLTQTHRQALKSGIVSQSVKVCSGESLCKNDFYGEEIRGELQDFKLIAAYDLTEIQMKIIEEFRRLYFKEHIALDKIQIIIPTRVRGNNSCRVINSMIQEIVNPGFRNDSAVVEYNENGFKYTVTYKVNDRIIVNRNNYHALNVDGDEVAIFNGNLGIIKKIYKDHMIIELPDQGEVILEREDWWNIGLAYAITVHKLQGSQAPYTIVAIDSSSYALLSRELIYTAITRATKYCTLITQPKMLNLGIKISAIKQKQTWLQQELFNLYIRTQERDIKYGENN